MNDRPHAINESSPSEPRIEGRYAVLAILALALGLSTFGVVYIHRQQRRPIDFWGTDAAVLIVRAPQVMALRLAETDLVRPQENVAAQSVGELGQQRLRVAEQVEVSHAGGITHVRRSLVSEKAFDWSAPSPSEPEWQYALEFLDGDDWPSWKREASVDRAGGRGTSRVSGRTV